MTDCKHFQSESDGEGWCKKKGIPNPLCHYDYDKCKMNDLLIYMQKLRFDNLKAREQVELFICLAEDWIDENR